MRIEDKEKPAYLLGYAYERTSAAQPDGGRTHPQAPGSKEGEQHSMVLLGEMCFACSAGWLLASR
jgi:hypothetical protein